MRNLILTLCFALTILAMAEPAYAYLDPGTGSVFLQGLLAGVAGALAVLKLYWQRFKNFILNLRSKIFKSSPANDSKNHD